MTEPSTLTFFKDLHGAIVEDAKRINELSLERDRYRSALERIADTPLEVRSIDRPQAVAKAALTDPQPETDCGCIMHMSECVCREEPAESSHEGEGAT